MGGILLGIALLPLVAAPPNAVEQPSRLWTVLPNGATVLALATPETDRMVVQIVAGGSVDTPEAHGRRHLLEHLVAKGRGDLDMRLESVGAFLFAETTRDALTVSVSGPDSVMDKGLAALREVLEVRSWTAEQIAREAAVMGQELALRSDSALFSSAMWRLAYGEAGLDPLGDAKVLATTTPDDVRAIQERTFAASRMILTVSGPHSVDELTKLGRSVVETLPKGNAPRPAERPAGKNGRVEVAGAFGEARAALAPSFTDPKTAAVVAAGFAIAGTQAGGYLTYTPTERPGLVIVGQTDDNGGLGMRVDEWSDGEKAALFESARNLARRWFDRMMESPRDSASLRAGLALWRHGGTPEAFRKNLDALTQAQFLAAFRAFSPQESIVAVGVER